MGRELDDRLSLEITPKWAAKHDQIDDTLQNHPNFSVELI